MKIRWCSTAVGSYSSNNNNKIGNKKWVEELENIAYVKTTKAPQKKQGKNISKDEGTWIKISFCSHNFFGWKAHSHRSKYNAKMVTNCPWTPVSYREPSMNQAENVTCLN